MSSHFERNIRSRVLRMMLNFESIGKYWKADEITSTFQTKGERETATSVLYDLHEEKVVDIKERTFILFRRNRKKRMRE